MTKFLISLMMVISLNFIISCSGKTTTGSTDESVQENSEKENTETSNPNTATLSAEQLQSIGVQIDTIEQKQLTATIKANGVLRVPNQNKASIHSIYAGIIKTLLVQPGNYVSKGQTIATITNPEFTQVQSEYIKLNTKISLVELEVKRQKELNAGNAGALKNLQSAETELKNLHTAKTTYAQEITMMGINPATLQNGKLNTIISVKSPINGVISTVLVKIGSNVDVTTAIAEIIDNSQLHLDLFVYEKDISLLKNNQVIHFTVTNNPGKEYDAKVYSLGSSFEGESKAVTVHAKVPGDKNGLIDGMNVTAAISLKQTTVPAVPNEAIVTINGKEYIFILLENKTLPKPINTFDKDSLQQNIKEKPTNKQGKIAPEANGKTFERIQIAKGTTAIGYTEITLLKQLPAGTKIVTKGAFFVAAKMTNVEEE